MEINFAQVLTNALVSIVVGAVSAWVAGSLGVREGLRRGRAERAFERRFDWYEQTFRAFNKFTLNLRKLVPTPIASDAFSPLAAEFLKSGEEVRSCVDGATVYAKKSTLVEMRMLFVELDQTRHLAEGANIETADLLRKAGAIIDIANRITYELATSIRDQLGLDKITVEDFRWGRPS